MEETITKYYKETVSFPPDWELLNRVESASDESPLTHYTHRNKLMERQEYEEILSKFET